MLLQSNYITYQNQQNIFTHNIFNANIPINNYLTTSSIEFQQTI